MTGSQWPLGLFHDLSSRRLSQARKRHINMNFLVRLPLGGDDPGIAPGTHPSFLLILHNGSPVCPRNKPSLSLGQFRGRREAEKVYVLNIYVPFSLAIVGSTLTRWLHSSPKKTGWSAWLQTIGIPIAWHKPRIPGFLQKTIREGAISLLGQGPESHQNVSCIRATQTCIRCSLGVALERETFLGLSFDWKSIWGPRTEMLQMLWSQG